MFLKKTQNALQPAEVNKGTVLLLQVPRTNEKKELAAEQMFASLHGLLSSAQKKLFARAVHERVSFEIAVKKKRIGFYVWVPEHLKSFVEEQIYAQYPTVEISEVDDYATHSGDYTTHMTSELKLIANDALPIKTFPSFEVDPLAAITATLAKFDDHEEAWLQVIVRPAQDNWHKKSEAYASGIRNKSSGSNAMALMTAVVQAPGESSGGGSVKLAEHETARASAAETKSQKLAYEVCLRMVYSGNVDATHARMRLQAIAATFKQFNTTYLNGFSVRTTSEDQRQIEMYQQRAFRGKGFTCNIEEVASLYHLPHTNVETPNILWARAKTAEPPATLPLITEENKDRVSPMAVTNFRGHHTMFGLLREDRGRHLYIIGQTGVGKSGMLQLLTISDIYSPYGFAVIDPHGDYAQSILRRIPEHRVKDVLYFNPADTDFPIAFNPMEVTDDKLKTHTCSELIGVLKRMFESWGPRLEYILRYSILALLDYPEATMLDITRILTDKKFRAEVLTHVNDPVVRNFWTVEFASWNDKFAAEAVAPVLNKVGAFTANPIVRNIIGQPKSSFNIRKIMDERKILVVNLSRGLIGEDNASLLGALLVTKIQMAAMSRADQHEDDRIPFYLYVDEFQNFATDSFATILSEARKYALNLTVANQYIAQMSQEVRDAVFGNVGSIITFRTSADDARIMQRYFEPHFMEHDLVHMHNLNFAISMIIEGEKVPAFSGTSLRLPEFGHDYTAQIVENTRSNHSVNRDSIELFMHDRYDAKQQPQQPAARPQKRPPNKPRVAAAKSTTTTDEPKDAPAPPADTAKPLTRTVVQKTADAQKMAKDVLKFATSTLSPNAKDTPKTPAPDAPEAPKKKRRRRRRKSTKPSDASTQSTPKTPAKNSKSADDKKDDDPSVLYLR